MTQLALEEIQRRLQGEPGGVRRISIEGKEARADRVAAECLTPSLFGGRPLLVLRNPMKIPEGEVEGLKAYVERPSPSACLAFVAEEVDGRRSLVAHLRAHAQCLEFGPPRGDEVEALLDREAERLGKRLDPEAARSLAEAVGSNLMLALRELEKSALHAGEAPRIRVEDVQAVVVEAREESVWEMGDAILEGRTSDALVSLEGRRREGDPPVLLIGALARMFRQFWWAASEIERGRPPLAILNDVFGPRIASWKGPRILSALKGSGASFARKALEGLAALDRDTKRSRLDRWLLFETFVLELGSVRRPGRSAPRTIGGPGKRDAR